MQEVDQILAKYSGAASRLPPRKSSVHGELPAKSLQVGDVHGPGSRKLDVRGYKMQQNSINAVETQNEIAQSLTLQDVGGATGKKDQILLRDVMEQSVTASALENQIIPAVEQSPMKTNYSLENKEMGRLCKECGITTNCVDCQFCGQCGCRLSVAKPEQRSESYEPRNSQNLQTAEIWEAVNELRGSIRSLHLELLKVTTEQQKLIKNVTENIADVKNLLRKNHGIV